MGRGSFLNLSRANGVWEVLFQVLLLDSNLF